MAGYVWSGRQWYSIFYGMHLLEHGSKCWHVVQSGETPLPGVIGKVRFLPRRDSGRDASKFSWGTNTKSYPWWLISCQNSRDQKIIRRLKTKAWNMCNRCTRNMLTNSSLPPPPFSCIIKALDSSLILDNEILPGNWKVGLVHTFNRCVLHLLWQKTAAIARAKTIRPPGGKTPEIAPKTPGVGTSQNSFCMLGDVIVDGSV